MTNGLHMFECTTQRSGAIWILGDYLIRCSGGGLSYVMNAGEEPTYTTHTDASQLPEELQPWYDKIHMRTENPDDGVYRRLVEKPQHPVYLDIFVYLDNQRGARLRRQLEPFSSINRTGVHDRMFVPPERVMLP